MGYRSKNSTVKSPVSKYLSWSSEDKCFKYWDKAKETNVFLKLPIKFTALDDFVGVSGGAEDSAGQFHPVTSGIAAHINKVLVVKKDRSQVIATGKWADIKDSVKAEGGRYTSYVYAVYKDELVCFKIAGAALAGWFDKADGDKITVKESVKKKKGSNTYYQPVFETAVLTDADKKKLDELDAVKEFDKYSEAKHAQKFDADDESVEEEAPEKKVAPNLSDDEVDEMFE